MFGVARREGSKMQTSISKVPKPLPVSSVFRHASWDYTCFIAQHISIHDKEATTVKKKSGR